jgi:pimeloyl-ACP methyl ester carboxylesterase
MINYQSFGEVSDTPSLLIAHGLFGSARNWRAIGRNLSVDRQVHVVDMRNHGDSFWDDDNSYFAMADDLAKVIAHIGAPMDVLGHSMGGKASMVLALQNPDFVNRLLVADIAPKPYEHDQVSNVDIMKALDLSSFTRRTQADAILAQSIPEAAIRAFFLQSLNISEQGNSWQLNLDALKVNMPLIVGFPEVTGLFNGEVLFLRGGESPYVLDSDMPDILANFPAAILQTIDGAGHWLHAEATREFITASKAFFT